MFEKKLVKVVKDYIPLKVLNFWVSKLIQCPKFVPSPFESAKYRLSL